MELHRTFEPTEQDEHPGLREMRELERLARKRPCTMTSEQWKAYEEYQEKRDEQENE